MKGRDEIDKKYEIKNQKKLELFPNWGIDYYYSLTNKTMKTKDLYLTRVISFLNYAKDNLNINIDDPSDFQNVKASQITRYIETCSQSDSQKRTVYYALKSLFEYFLMDEYIEKDLFYRLNPPKDKNKPEIVSLNPSEIQMILYNMDHPIGRNGAVRERRLKNKSEYKALFLLGVFTGLRNSSIMEINIEDIDWDNKVIPVVQKGNTIHNAMLSDELIEILKEWLIRRDEIIKETGSTTSALFISHTGKRITSDFVEHMLDWSTYNIEKNITPHKMRSTCCTQLIKKTGDITIAANVLGHANIYNTMRYIDNKEGFAEKGVKVMNDILFDG